MNYLIALLVATYVFQIPCSAQQINQRHNPLLICTGNDSTWKQLMDDAHIASNTGNEVHAAELLNKALDQALQFGAEDSRVPRTLQELGNAYTKLGRLEEAETFLRRALELDEKLTGADSAAVSSDLSTLALTLSEQAHVKEAIAMIKHALEIAQKRYPPDDEHTVSIVANLGATYIVAGQYALAESTLKQALEMRKKNLGSTDESTMYILNSLGSVCENTDRLSEAEAHYKDSLAIREAVFGSNNPKVAIALNSLSIVYDRQNRPDETEKVLNRALDILKAFPGSHDLLIAAIYNNLGMAYKVEKKYSAAKEALNKSIAIRDKILGPEHPLTAISLSNFGAISFAEGNTKEAQTYLQKAVAIFEKTSGPDHPNTKYARSVLSKLSDPNYIYADKTLATTLSDGNAAEKAGNYPLAITHFRKAITLTEKLPNQAKYAASFYVNLGTLERKLNHITEAEIYFKKALALADTNSCIKPSIASGACSSLGTIYFTQHKLPLCEQFCRRAVKIDEANASIPVETRVVNLSNLAQVIASQGKYVDAIPLMKKALDQSSKAFGPYHQTTIRIATSYKMLQMRMGKKP